MRDCARRLRRGRTRPLAVAGHNLPHPEERAFARVSKDGPRASWFETGLKKHLPHMRKIRSQQRQASRPGPARKGLVERRDLVTVEREFPSRGIVGGVFLT